MIKSDDSLSFQGIATQDTTLVETSFVGPLKIEFQESTHQIILINESTTPDNNTLYCQYLSQPSVLHSTIYPAFAYTYPLNVNSTLYFTSNGQLDSNYNVNDIESTFILSNLQIWSDTINTSNVLSFQFSNSYTPQGNVILLDGDVLSNSS